MKRNPLDYNEELLMNMGQMGKRSWNIKKVETPREQQMLIRSNLKFPLKLE